MYLLRTRFKKDIVAEFLPPTRKSSKVIVFCSGMPSVPSKALFMEFFAKKGYWFIYPRYRGTWESGGRFLKFSPERDILDVIDSLPRGFKDLYSGKVYKIKHREIYLLGSSFGGAAALLASRDRRVKKAILVAPVADWVAPRRGESLGWLKGFVQESFGESYRFNKKDWDKLEKGNFYNPVRCVDEIDGKKLLIIHAKDDKNVHYGPVAKFAKKVGAKLITLKRGGHLRSALVTKPRFYKLVKKFLSEKS